MRYSMDMWYNKNDVKRINKQKLKVCNVQAETQFSPGSHDLHTSVAISKYLAVAGHVTH